MATKEKTGRKKETRRGTVRMSRRALLGTAEAGAGFLLGTVLSGAALFGICAPFGVAAVAAAGSGVTGFCTLAGACLGYLCLKGMTDGMRYAAAAILTYAVAFAFYDAKFCRRFWFMPATAAVFTALTGFVTRGGQGWHGQDLIYFVTEVALTALAAACYRTVLRQWPEVLKGFRSLSPGQGAGVVTLAGTVLMALGRVELLDTFSAGRLLGALVVMIAARQGMEEGAMAGACAGIALDLGARQAPYYSLIYALSGLSCGLCRQRGKLVAAGVYLFTTVVSALWTWEGQPRVGLPLETLAAAVIFLFLRLPAPAKEEAPPALAAGQPRDLGKAARRELARQLETLSQAFHTLREALGETLTPPREEETNIFTRTADKVCARCVLRNTCWRKDYESTRTVLEEANRPALERGRVLATDFAGHFSSRCIHFPDFLGEANRQLTGLLRRRQSLQRTRAVRTALCEQYERLDKLLEQTAAEAAAGLAPDAALGDKLNGFLRERELGEGAVYRDSAGRLWVETPAAELLQTRPARRALSDALAVTLQEPAEEGERLYFRQAAPYRGEVAMHGAPRTGEEISGDVGLWFRRDDRVLYLLLCDGMGSGPEAREESTRTAKLIRGFLQAGMEPEQALPAVADTLALRGEAAGATTVDLLAVDLFTGRCGVYKQGAAPSYLRRGRQIRRVEGLSLPAGTAMGERGRPNVHSLRGEPGDWIVLLSDGILCGQEDRWLQTLLEDFQGTSPEQMAEVILQASRRERGGEDDGTVLVLHLERWPEL